MSRFDYPDMVSDVSTITEVLVLDLVLDKWGKIDVGESNTNSSLCPIRPIFLDKSPDYYSGTPFHLLFVKRNSYCIELLGGVNTVKNLGKPITIETSVTYGKIGFFRQGMTRFFEIRLFFNPNYNPEEAELYITCSHPEYGILSENVEFVGPNTSERSIFVDFQAPYIDLTISTTLAAVSLIGLEIVAEQSGRR